MFKTLSTLFKAQVAEAEEAIFDANATRLLEQRIREASSAFEAGKRDLALVLAEEAGERRCAEAADAKVRDLDAEALAALDAGDEAVARETAQRIAFATDEAAAHRAAAADCAEAAARLRAVLERHVRLLAELKRGLATTRAAAALDRVSERSCRAAGLSDSAIQEARRTLERIRSRQSRQRDFDEAMDQVESEPGLRAPGAEPVRRVAETSVDAVLSRLRSSRSGGGVN